MYREPDRTPHCAACGRTTLTPPTLLDPSEGYLNVHFQEKTDKPAGWLGPARERFSIKRVRICIECGHVMLFLDAQTLGTLRARLPGLEAMEPVT